MTSTISKIALVTGANKGIGLEISRQLARLGCTVLLGSRNSLRGEDAAQRLRADGLDVRAVSLDTDNPSTFLPLRDLIETDFGHLDILVNNAGVGLDWEFDATSVPPDLLRRTFNTNFFGVVELTQTLLPLLLKSTSPRIVNQSSILGSLSLRAAPEFGIADVAPLAYNTSKSALNAFTIHLAIALKNSAVKVNAAHPGSVVTDMNPHGELSMEDGAKTAVELATLPDDGPTGGFFHLGEPIPW